MSTALDWCAYHGVAVDDGVAVVYKAVRDDYRSAHGLSYAPGLVPEACDWDGGKEECGGGLHFSPTPTGGLAFDAEATRFIACPVAVVDMRPPQNTDRCPGKIKAWRCCGSVHEVCRDGRPIGVGV
jgi:hypothetical protein